jgi:hypothetical protein
LLNGMVFIIADDVLRRLEGELDLEERRMDA